MAISNTEQKMIHLGFGWQWSHSLQDRIDVGIIRKIEIVFGNGDLISISKIKEYERDKIEFTAISKLPFTSRKNDGNSEITEQDSLQITIDKICDLKIRIFCEKQVNNSSKLNSFSEEIKFELPSEELEIGQTYCLVVKQEGKGLFSSKLITQKRKELENLLEDWKRECGVDYSVNKIIEDVKYCFDKKISKLKIDLNAIRKFPDVFNFLTHLEVLSIENYRPKGPDLGFPDSLGNLKNLKSLTFNNCNLKPFPNTCLRLTNLEKLTILDRSSETLPEWLHEFDQLPDSIFNLPKLKFVEFHPSKS